MDTEILQWINEYQSGKSGIYPYKVAEMVTARFNVTIKHALELVLIHIKNETTQE